MKETALPCGFASASLNTDSCFFQRRIDFLFCSERFIKAHNMKELHHLYLSFSVSDPATCPIVPGQETVIEISKGRSGLGLSIVGGKDTQLVWYQ